MLRLDINIVWTILNLLIIFAIVKIFLIKPSTRSWMQDRQRSISNMQMQKLHRTVPKNSRLSTRHP